MQFAELTGDQRQFFDDEGYLVVEKALGTDQIAELTEVCDRIMEAYGNGGKPIKQLRAGLIEEPAFRNLIAHSTTVPLVVQLLNPNIHVQNTAIIYKYPEDAQTAEPVRAWHRDIGITRDIGHVNQPRIGIKVCYCLTDFLEPESGITRFSPQSHLTSEPLGIPGGEVDPLEVLQPECKTGDALFFENRIFHTKAPNLTNRTSKVIMVGYSYSWMRNGYYLEDLDHDVISCLDPIERQLLDVKENENWAAAPNSTASK